MKYMVTWRLSSENFEDAAREFLAGKGDPPVGLTHLGRWHVPGSSYGWHLMEGDEGALAQHLAFWGQYLDIEVSPVVEDDVAGAAMQSVFGD